MRAPQDLIDDCFESADDNEAREKFKQETNAKFQGYES